MIETMSVRQAAEEMGKPEQWVRVGLQQGAFPWGYAVKVDKHYSYFINAKRFRETEGVS